MENANTRRNKATEDSIKASFQGQTFAEQMLLRGSSRSSRIGSLLMSSFEMNHDVVDDGKKGDSDQENEQVDKIEYTVPSKTPRMARMMSIKEAGLLGIDTTEDNLFQKVMGVSIDEKDEIITSIRGVSLSDMEDVTTSERTQVVDPYNVPFESQFKPDEMRCLALVAHNHMKPAMKDFVLSHKAILKKFRLTGTNTTMTMLRSVFGDDPTVMFGPTCQSGPLGGDAELCALMCLEDLGGMIFFMDPLSAHPHQADIDSLVRLSNVHNIISAPNPATAHALCFVLKCALEEGRKDKIPSFFYSLKSPGVKVYEDEQRKQVEKNT